jgi:metal-dependent amidase/aminoacylase/carboxypeptidase family protein
MLAGGAIIDIKVKGKGGHGAMPHAAVDPITPLFALHQQI